MVMDDYQEQLASFEETCRAFGLKVTHQRLEIYRALLQSTDHPSAETLHKELVKRMQSLSLDTVYRTLATFEKLGLALRVQTVESQTRFEARKFQHHHLICDRCKKILDFEWKEFDNITVPADVKILGKVTARNAILKGICSTCLQEEEALST